MCCAQGEKFLHTLQCKCADSTKCMTPRFLHCSKFPLFSVFFSVWCTLIREQQAVPVKHIAGFCMSICSVPWHLAGDCNSSHAAFAFQQQDLQCSWFWTYNALGNLNNFLLSDICLRVNTEKWCKSINSKPHSNEEGSQSDGVLGWKGFQQPMGSEWSTPPFLFINWH